MAMFVFALIALTTIVYFIYVLARFIISRDENILTLLVRRLAPWELRQRLIYFYDIKFNLFNYFLQDILGIALCIASMSVAYMAVRNFGKCR